MSALGTVKHKEQVKQWYENKIRKMSNLRIVILGFEYSLGFQMDNQNIAIHTY